MLIKTPHNITDSMLYRAWGYEAELYVPNKKIRVQHHSQIENLLADSWGTESAAMYEKVKVIYITRNGIMRAVEDHETGGTYSAFINTAKIIEIAHRLSGRGLREVDKVVVAHNHPSGFNIHSEGDLNFFSNMSKQLGESGVELLDSYVLGIQGVPHIELIAEQLKTIEGAIRTDKQISITEVREKLQNALQFLQSRRNDYLRSTGIVAFSRLSKEDNLCNGV